MGNNSDRFSDNNRRSISPLPSSLDQGNHVLTIYVCVNGFIDRSIEKNRICTFFLCTDKFYMFDLEDKKNRNIFQGLILYRC
jgi:hypothetical protein